MDSKIISERLVSLRGSRSQREVSKALGISTSALAMYEGGHRIPRDEIKIKIAEYYNKSVQAIFFTQKCHKK
jgi:transcriptional regulator with XRE-family HTH domain